MNKNVLPRETDNHFNSTKLKKESRCGIKMWSSGDKKKSPFMQIAASCLLLVVGKLLRDGFKKKSLFHNIIVKALICQAILKRYNYN